MDTEDEGGQTPLNFELKYEAIISLKDGKSTTRVARFLRPCARNQNEAASIPNTPLMSEIIASSDPKIYPSNITFKGRTFPQRGWIEWVDRLASKHAAFWNQTSICDAIMSSLYEVHWNQELVLGLVEFWCPETNTFIFPWGEATVTLEDVMILGGYPVIGEAISGKMTEEEKILVEEMNRQRLKLNRTRAKKASFSGWLHHFMEETTKFEHAGFLAFWLSRHVLPSLPADTICKHVFPIAAQLSQGRRLALAPTVLASLYKNLTLLREQVITTSESVIVAGPFQLLLLWAFEHIPSLAPNLPNKLKPGEPRVARWHELNLKLTIAQVKSALRQPENFEWRPYAADYENWRHLSYYKEIEQLLSSSFSVDEEMSSYFQCLWPSELVGLDSKEMYRPQRVAMQFGMDQDLPADCCALNLALDRLVFFVPPRSFLAGVSERYFEWWKDLMSAREGAIKDVLLQSEDVTKPKVSISDDEAREDKENVCVSVSSRKPTIPVKSRVLTESRGKSYNSSVSPLTRKWKDDFSVYLNLKNSNILSQSPAENCRLIVDETKLAGKYGFDQGEEAAVKYNTIYLPIGEGKAKRKAGSSAGDPIIIIGESWETIKRSREGRKSSTVPPESIEDDPKHNEVKGKSIRNPILIC